MKIMQGLNNSSQKSIQFPIPKIFLGLVKLPPDLIFILIFSLAINLIGLWWGIWPGSIEDWGADTIAPRDVFHGASQWFSNGWHTRYPPLHYYILAITYSPFLALHTIDALNAQSPIWYAVLFYLGRSISLLMSIVILIGIYKISLLVNISGRGAILSALIAAINPLFVYYSKTTNLDIPYTMWLVCSFFFCIRALRYHAFRDYLLFYIFGVFSISTKDQAYGFFVLTTPIIFLDHWRSTGQKSIFPASNVRERIVRIVVPPMAALGVFIILNNLIFNIQGFIAHLRLIIGPASIDYRVYENTFTGHISMTIQSLRHMIFATGWPMFALTVIGLAHAVIRWKNYRVMHILLLGISSYYLFFISVIGYNYDRFFLPVICFTAVYIGAFLEWYLSRQTIPKSIRVITVLLVFGFSFLYALSVNTLMIADSRNHAVSWMRGNIPSDSNIYGIGKTYYLPPLAGFSEKTITSHPSAEELIKLHPDYVVYSSIYNQYIFEPGSLEHQFFEGIQKGKFNYELAYSYQGKPIFNLINRTGILTNFDKLNPEIYIFKRVK